MELKTLSRLIPKIIIVTVISFPTQARPRELVNLSHRIEKNEMLHDLIQLFLFGKLTSTIVQY